MEEAVTNLRVCSVYEHSCSAGARSRGYCRRGHNIENRAEVEVREEAVTGASLHEGGHSVAGHAADLVEDVRPGVGVAPDLGPLGRGSPGGELLRVQLGRPVGRQRDVVQRRHLGGATFKRKVIKKHTSGSQLLVTVSTAIIESKREIILNKYVSSFNSVLILQSSVQHFPLRVDWRC